MFIRTKNGNIIKVDIDKFPNEKDLYKYMEN